MTQLSKAQHLLDQIDETTKLGDIRALAKEIKRDHEFALTLWSSETFLPRQLALLIMDKKLLDEELIDRLVTDIGTHPEHERDHLIDWLMANQLSKDKKTIAMMETWADSASPLKRRVFWYYQARLRWVGQTPPPNTEELLLAIEAQIAHETPAVQWAMNFTAAQIGIFQPEYRQRCISLGERTGLYQDEIVAKNCTPNYLPKFIAMQVAKLEK